jgi:hypothetical protein
VGPTSITIPVGVTIIPGNAFFENKALTSVAIPEGVTSIAGGAFYRCIALTNIIIPKSVTSIEGNAFRDCVSLATVSIARGVTFIGKDAFQNCISLRTVSIPDTVAQIAWDAFGGCVSLTAAYFQGNAPFNYGRQFENSPATIVYYLPGTTGWGPTFGGAPTVLWNPQGQALRIAAGRFGFEITGPADAVIVVEANANLSTSEWLPVSTNALSVAGTTSFADSESGGYAKRFYRFRSP